jgi:antitoxin StbD
MIMSTRILADVATSITELKANPMKAVASGHGKTVAVLNHNAPAFYCVPAEAYEKLLDALEDVHLLNIAKTREKEPNIKVKLDDL